MYAQNTNNETCTRKHHCFFVVHHVGKAQLDSLDKVERVESSRDEPSGIWAIVLPIHTRRRLRKKQSTTICSRRGLNSVQYVHSSDSIICVGLYMHCRLQCLEKPDPVLTITCRRHRHSIDGFLRHSVAYRPTANESRNESLYAPARLLNSKPHVKVVAVRLIIDSSRS